MAEIKPIDREIGIAEIIGDPNEPKDPHDLWTYRIEKIFIEFSGQANGPEIAATIQNRIRELCLDFVHLGHFPQELWHLHNNVSVSYQFTEINIGLPLWIHVWYATRRMMSSMEVQDYLDNPEKVLRRHRDPLKGYRVLY